MTAAFVPCAPLALGGAALEVFAANPKPVTWSEVALPGSGYAIGPQGIGSDGNGKILLGTNTNGVLLQSLDSGSTWEQVAGLQPSAGDRLQNGLAYGAGVWLGLGTTGLSDLWRSTDGGATWAHLSSSLLGGNGYLAYNSQSGVWMATEANSSGVNDRFSISSDGGSTWSAPVHMGLASTAGPMIYDPIDDVWVFFSAPTSTGKLSIFTNSGSGWVSQQFAHASVGASQVMFPCHVDTRYFSLVTQNTGGLPPTYVVASGSSWADLAAAPLSSLPAMTHLDSTLSAIAIDGQGRLIAVGNLGSASTSLDGGASWTHDVTPWASGTNVFPKLIVSGAKVTASIQGPLIGLRQGLC